MNIEHVTNKPVVKVTNQNVSFVEEALASTFGYEWHELAMLNKWKIADDFAQAHSEEGLSASEYKARIHEGNLYAYVITLRNTPSIERM